MGFWYDILIQTGAYVVSFSAGFILLNLMMGGFIASYLRVRLSFGKKTLVQVRSRLRDYFRVGQVYEGWLVYKGGDKNTRRQNLPEGKDVFSRVYGVDVVHVDEERGTVAGIDFAALDGTDPVKTEDLYVRALMRPSISYGGKEKILLVLLVLVALGVGFAIYTQFGQGDEIIFIKEKIGELFAAVGPQEIPK